MTDGQRLVAAALAQVGVSEATGRNDGALIEAWQREAELAHPASSPRGYHPGALTGAAWCAIFVKAMARDAGVQIDPMLTHPFTGYICQRADELGGLRPRGLAPVGSLFIKCGVHAGIVVRDRGNGLFDTVEGNSGNAVRQLVRDQSDGWRFVAWPGVGSAAGDAVVMRDSYGFDDLNLRPFLYGGWRTERARRIRREAFLAARPGWWAADVRIDTDSPFAFRAGPPGTYGATWRFGGWGTKALRAEKIEGYSRRVGHENLRIWSKRVPVVQGDDRSGVVTGDSDLSTR
jgi:hypothetical protein